MNKLMRENRYYLLNDDLSISYTAAKKRARYLARVRLNFIGKSITYESHHILQRRYFSNYRQGLLKEAVFQCALQPQYL